MCVRVTKGSFTVLACGELNYIPHYLNNPTGPPLSPGIHLWVSVFLSCPGCHGYCLKRHPGRRTEVDLSLGLHWLLEFAMNYNPEAPGAEAGWQ